MVKTASEITVSQSTIINILKYDLYKKEVIRKLERQDRDFWEKNNKRFKDINKDIITGEKLDKIVSLIVSRLIRDCQDRAIPVLFINVDVAPVSLMDKYRLKHALKYLDLASMLAKFSKPQRLMFTINPHYNDCAHRIIGEYVARYLVENYSCALNHRFNYRFAKLQ